MTGWLQRHGSSIGVLLLLTLILLTRCAVPRADAATVNPPCGSYPVAPPLVFVTPDGVEIPASGAVYALDARRIEIIGYDRIFCDGFEGG